MPHAGRHGTDERRTDFEREVMEAAQLAAQAAAKPYASLSPKEVAATLRTVERAVSKLLDALVEHRIVCPEEQNAQLPALNAPALRALRYSGHLLGALRSGGILDPAWQQSGYPESVAEVLREFKEVAGFAANIEAPPRGNSNRRTVSAIRSALVGADFVSRYCLIFGRMPPMSQVGWVVDLLQQALDAAGLSGAEASSVLREAIGHAVEARANYPTATQAKAKDRRLK